MSSAINVAKPKALISCAVTAADQLPSSLSESLYLHTPKNRFSHVAAHQRLSSLWTHACIDDLLEIY